MFILIWQTRIQCYSGAHPQGFTRNDQIDFSLRKQWFSAILLPLRFRKVAGGSDGDLWTRLEQWLYDQASEPAPASTGMTDPILLALQ